jgi:hypothetical protein
MWDCIGCPACPAGSTESQGSCVAVPGRALGIRRAQQVLNLAVRLQPDSNNLISWFFFHFYCGTGGKSAAPAVLPADMIVENQQHAQLWGNVVDSVLDFADPLPFLSWVSLISLDEGPPAARLGGLEKPSCQLAGKTRRACAAQFFSMVQLSPAFLTHSTIESNFRPTLVAPFGS